MLQLLETNVSKPKAGFSDTGPTGQRLWKVSAPCRLTSGSPVCPAHPIYQKASPLGRTFQTHLHIYLKQKPRRENEGRVLLMTAGDLRARGQVLAVMHTTPKAKLSPLAKGWENVRNIKAYHLSSNINSLTPYRIFLDLSLSCYNSFLQNLRNMVAYMCLSVSQPLHLFFIV